MKFTEPLEQGVFLRRYKRFFADIMFNNEEITAHVPNTGSLKGVNDANRPCRFTVNNDPKRKLKYTLQMIKTPTSWVGVNTGLSNHLVWEAFQSGAVKQWRAFNGGQREVKISEKSRVDMVFWRANKTLPPDKKIKLADFKSQKFHFVEVKNVTLAKDGVAMFPDAVTLRGQKHLDELVELIEQGHSAEIVFTVQRQDCEIFCPADDIDPVYGDKLRQAKAKGLKVTAFPCYLARTKIELLAGEPLKIDL